MKERIKRWWRDGLRDIIIIAASGFVPIVLILSVIVNEHEENEATRERIRERQVQLRNTYKYEIRQYHGRGVYNAFYANSYTVEGSGIRFINENGKEVFVGGNFIVIPTH